MGLMKQHAVSGNVTIAMRLRGSFNDVLRVKPKVIKTTLIYARKRSCRKVMFSHVSVNLLTGGPGPYPISSDPNPSLYHTTLWGPTPLGPYPSWNITPRDHTPTLGTTKAGGTHPAGMLSSYTSIFVEAVVCVVTYSDGNLL